MEWWDHQNLIWLQQFMTERNFYFVKNIEGDIVYVKKNSEAHHIVKRENLRGKFIVYVPSNKTEKALT